MGHAQLTITLDERALAKLARHADEKHQDAAELVSEFVDDWLNAMEQPAAETEVDAGVRAGQMTTDSSATDRIALLETQAKQPSELLPDTLAQVQRLPLEERRAMAQRAAGNWNPATEGAGTAVEIVRQWRDEWEDRLTQLEQSGLATTRREALTHA